MIYQDTAPISPVTVSEAKSYMRVYHEIDDALIETFLQSATAEAEHRMQREIIKRHDPDALALTADEVPGGVKTFIYAAVDNLYRFRGVFGEADLKSYAPHLLDPWKLYNRDPDETWQEDESI